MSTKSEDVREINLYDDDGEIEVAMLLIFRQGGRVRRARINRRQFTDLIVILCNANGLSTLRWSKRSGICSVGMGAKGDAREVAPWPHPWWKKPLQERGE